MTCYGEVAPRRAEYSGEKSAANKLYEEVCNAALQLIREVDASVGGGIKGGRVILYTAELQVVLRLNPDAFSEVMRRACYSMPPVNIEFPCELFGVPVRINRDGTSAPPVSIAFEPIQ